MEKNNKKVYIVGFLPDSSEYARILIEANANLVDCKDYPEFFECHNLSFKIFGSATKDLTEKKLSELVYYIDYEEFQVHNGHILLPKELLKDKNAVSSTDSMAMLSFSRTCSLCYKFISKVLDSRPVTLESLNLDKERKELVQARLEEVVIEDK